jgi:hypothetical protein
MEHPYSEIGWRFGLTVWITVQFLLTAYFEYYYFTQTIITTNHLMDALSPLVLGIIQGFAIYCLRANGSVSDWWWLWEFVYVSFGIGALVHSWLHIPASVMQSGKSIISETIVLTIVMCATLILLIFCGGLSAHFRVHWLVNLILVLMSYIAGTGTAKSFIYLNRWERCANKSARGVEVGWT